MIKGDSTHPTTQKWTRNEQSHLLELTTVTSVKSLSPQA